MNHKEEEPLALNKEQQKEIVRQYELLLKAPLTIREHGDEGYSSRNPYQRDYSRILYSPSFRRLQGKMQIVGIKSSSFFRNRLTHSLEVSQIATSIARLLSISCDADLFEDKQTRMYDDDIHLIEAAALAHDIGHPAFGHKGERVLNELGKEYSIRFEGNAHNFRILRTLEKKEPKVSGLNLTPRTLLAINKYIVNEDNGKEPKKFMFREDYNKLQKVRNQVKGLEMTRTLDVQIIELADDIAYAVHDLEDGLMLRNFTIDEILFGIQKESTDDYNLFSAFVNKAKEYSQDEKVNNVQEYSKIFRMSLTSQLTHAFINDITISKTDQADVHGTSKDVMELSLKDYGSLLRNLKDVVFDCTTRRNEVRLYELRGEIVLKNLYYIYTNIETNEDGMLMPPYYRPSIKYKKINKEDKHAIDDYHRQLSQHAIDYIAGMMDTFAIEEFERLTNKKFNEIDLKNLDEINRKLEERKRLKEKNYPPVRTGWL